MRVLVCGGRTYSDVHELTDYLDFKHHERPFSALIEGGAPGADRLAALWAGREGIPVETFRADWKAHGRAAGPVRNQRMIDEGKPDLAVAFTGGRGTADMMRRATAAGVATEYVSVAAAMGNSWGE